MYNNANFKIKNLVLPAGPQTLIVRPGKDAPVSLEFIAEDQKDYEIVKQDGQIKVYCSTDGSFVATGTSVLYKETDNASANSDFEQHLKVQLKKFRATVRICAIDGFFGEKRLHYGGYTFPDQDGIAKIQLTPGKHTLEFTINTKTRFSNPVRLDFEAMEHKTYTLKLELHEEKGTGFFQFGKNYYFSAKVVELED